MGSDGKLTVKHRASGYYFGHAPQKVLTVRIPKKMLSKLERVTVVSESANVLTEGSSAKNICVETVSGSVILSDCEAQALKLETVNGGATVTGTFGSIEAETVSGNITVRPTHLTEAVKLSSVRGEIRISLTEDSSFRVRFDTTSGSLTSDFALRSDGEGKVFGDGAIPIEVSTVSGDVTIEKRAIATP